MYVFTILLELLLCFVGTTGGEFLALSPTPLSPLRYPVCPLPLFLRLCFNTKFPLLTWHVCEIHNVSQTPWKALYWKYTWRIKSANTIPGYLIGSWLKFIILLKCTLELRLGNSGK